MPAMTRTVATIDGTVICDVPVLDETRRVTGDDGERRSISCYDTARCHYSTGSNANARQDHGSSTHPNRVTDGHGRGQIGPAYPMVVVGGTQHARPKSHGLRRIAVPTIDVIVPFVRARVDLPRGTEGSSFTVVRRPQSGGACHEA